MDGWIGHSFDGLLVCPDDVWENANRQFRKASIAAANVCAGETGVVYYYGLLF